MRRYTAAAPAAIPCPSFVTDNETDLVSTGQGRQLYDDLTCPKTFRRFTRAEGAEGHCEGMAPSCSGPPPSIGSTDGALTRFAPSRAAIPDTIDGRRRGPREAPGRSHPRAGALQRTLPPMPDPAAAPEIAYAEAAARAAPGDRRHGSRGPRRSPAASSLRTRAAYSSRRCNGTRRTRRCCWPAGRTHCAADSPRWRAHA